MTAALQENSQERPVIQVDVVEPGIAARPGTLRCVIDEHLWFDTARMESYFFAQWEPVLYDALLLAAAVEFCDITKRRPAHGWGRDIHLRLPVHNPEQWKQEEVVRALHDALDFLTGDRWQVTVYARQKPAPQPRQGLFSLGHDKSAVIPFSDGLDSLAVAGLASRELGESLVRVRLGRRKHHPCGSSLRREPFTSVPYNVRAGEKRPRRIKRPVTRFQVRDDQRPCRIPFECTQDHCSRKRTRRARPKSGSRRTRLSRLQKSSCIRETDGTVSEGVAWLSGPL